MRLQGMSWEILQTRACFGDLNVDGRMILKWILGAVQCEDMKCIQAS
jgi:hypothetical protein